MLDEDGPFIARVTAPAPAAASDPLFVIIRSFDGGRSDHGPCLWEPPAGALPAVGDLCVVVRALEEDGEGEQTIVIAFDRDDSAAIDADLAAIEADLAAETAARVAADTAHAIDTTAVHGIADTAKVVQSVESSLRIVRGIVTATGVITAGSGFSITKGATGFFTINFAIAFSGVPAVSVTPQGTTDLAAVISSAIPPTVSAVVLYTFDTSAGANADSAFHFIAIGPA